MIPVHIYRLVVRTCVIVTFVNALNDALALERNLDKWQEISLSYLLEDILEMVEPCTLLLAHDYEDKLPTSLLEVVANRYNQQRLTIVVKYNQTAITGPVTLPVSLPDPNELWFSWLHRPSAVSGGNCVFGAIFFHENHFKKLMEQTAMSVFLATAKDYFLLYNRDRTETNLTWLQHSHAKVLKFKIAAVPSPGEIMNLQSVCFYCHKGAPQDVSVGTYEYQNRYLHPLPALYPDFAKDLHGKTVRGIWIYDLEKEDLKRRMLICDPMYHIEAMWVFISDRMNYYFYVDTVPIDSTGLADTQLPNGTWVGMVGVVAYGDAEFAALTPNSAESLQVIDQTVTLVMDFMNFLTREPQPFYSWEAIFLPYTYDMWIMILISCTVSTIIFWRMIKILNRFQNAFHPKRPPTHTLGYSIRYLFFTVVEENPELLPTGHTLRVFLAFWWLFSIVITCAYDCKLISFLASPQLEDIPSTFAELSSKPGWEWGMNKTQAAFFPMMVEHSTNPGFHAVKRAMQKTDNYHICIGGTLERNFACIEIETLLVPTSLLFVYQDGHNPIKMQNEKDLLLYLSSLWPKNSVMLPVVNRLILKLFDSGFMNKFANDNIYCAFKTGLRMARAAKRDRHLSLDFKVVQLKGPLLVMAVFGWMVPLIVFGVEHHIHRKELRKQE